jgi:deoxycytidylate deaminase
MEPNSTQTIAYPYLPEGRTIEYVPADNPFIEEAKRYALANSLDKNVPNASIIVNNKNEIIGRGANGSTYHDEHGCERVRQGIPTGQGYDLCEGCHPKNHGEPKAIADAQRQGNETLGADLYMWGHWWCCKSCWDAMINAGIARIYLPEGAKVMFDKPRK